MLKVSAVSRNGSRVLPSVPMRGCPSGRRFEVCVPRFPGAPKAYFKPDPAEHGYPTNMDYFMLRTGEPYCRVCGYLPPSPPWGESGKEPSFEICPCCGVEWGYEDALDAGVVRFRSCWLAQGLNKWLRESPDASYHDRLVAQSLVDELSHAMAGAK